MDTLGAEDCPLGSNAAGRFQARPIYPASLEYTVTHILHPGVSPDAAAFDALNPVLPRGVRVVFSPLLGGWFVVRGRANTPIGGRFDSKAAALASLRRG